MKMTSMPGGEDTGFSWSTQARLVRSNTYAAVIHVLTDQNGVVLKPAVVVIAPHHFASEKEAQRYADEYARLMARDGALHVAVRLRDLPS